MKTRSSTSRKLDSEKTNQTEQVNEEAKSTNIEESLVATDPETLEIESTLTMISAKSVSVHSVAPPAIPPSLRIGYPCMNRTMKLTTSHNFKMANHTPERLIAAVTSNITDLKAMLDFNLENKLFFFRIGSEMVPFASHSKFKDSYDWKKHFAKDFKSIGNFVQKHSMRISMHPDQFVLINSPSEDIQQRSVAELQYHCDFLDALGLDSTHKIQIHVGGVYGDKESAIKRFVQRYKDLSPSIKKRLVVENDDRLYSLKDCMEIHEKTSVPILFDNLHHECLNNGEKMIDAIKQAMKTWNRERDGIIMMDYSSQEPGARKGRHTESIDIKHFQQYFEEIKGIEADIMLEIKDKETSALKAIKVIRGEDVVVETEEVKVETRTNKRKVTSEPKKKPTKRKAKSESNV